MGDDIHKLLDKFFTYHPPIGDQPKRYRTMRAAAMEFATCILENTPASPDQLKAIEHVRTATMFANAAVACWEPRPEVPEVDFQRTLTFTRMSQCVGVVFVFYRGADRKEGSLLRWRPETGLQDNAGRVESSQMRRVLGEAIMEFVSSASSEVDWSWDEHDFG
jgi:hypothetical protein